MSRTIIWSKILTNEPGHASLACFDSTKWAGKLKKPAPAKGFLIFKNWAMGRTRNFMVIFSYKNNKNMTKFILHGGKTGVSNKHNEAFYQEWVKDFDKEKSPTVLLVYFSRPKDIWNELKKSDKERFANYTDNREAKFIIASDDIEKFKEQIEETDVIYFRGGEPQKIVDVIGEIKNEFLSLIDGKVYAGSSAGVMFLSDYSRSANRGWVKYLSILPINSMVHYSEKLKGDLEEFKKNHPDNDKEYLLLPETEFVIKTF
jgi:Peptidase family S51